MTPAIYFILVILAVQKLSYADPQWPSYDHYPPPPPPPPPPPLIHPIISPPHSVPPSPQLLPSPLPQHYPPPPIPPPHPVPSLPLPCGPIPLPHPNPPPSTPSPPHLPPPPVPPPHPVPPPPPSHAIPSPHVPPPPVPPHYPPPLVPLPQPVPPPQYPLIPHVTIHDVPPNPPKPENPDVFPPGFSFGVLSGAYHHEGGWNQDGKEESIWDHWLHTNPCVVVDGSNGDYAADSYNHIKEDIEILNNLTVTHYRFSIPWSAVIYNGIGEINQVGLAHYKKLVHILKLYQIEPIVTLYHGDLPQVLQDQGGFLCSAFPEWYAYYARVLFENLGDEVKYWITFNDPTGICKGGYGDGVYAPGIYDGPGNNEYICGYNLLKAHAAAYHLYDDHYRCTQNGKLSIANEIKWYEPKTLCDTDIYAAETLLQFQVGWWAHPIYIGDYPSIMKERIPCDGYGHSSLPAFTHEEIAYIKNTHDFFALNYDSAEYVVDGDDGIQKFPCERTLTIIGIRKVLNWIKDQYYNPSVFIAGAGLGTTTRCLEDYDRIEWIKDILRNVRLSMIEDDTRVYGFSYYSYIDGFEWVNGYTLKYGLYDVNFECETRQRTPRKSAAYYQHLCSTGCIDDPCPPHVFELPPESPYPPYVPYPYPPHVPVPPCDLNLYPPHWPYPPHVPIPPCDLNPYPPHWPNPPHIPVPPCDLNPYSPHWPNPPHIPAPCDLNPHSPHWPYPPHVSPPCDGDPHTPHWPYPLHVPPPCDGDPHTPHWPYPPHVPPPCDGDPHSPHWPNPPHWP